MSESSFPFPVPMGIAEIEQCIPHRYPFLYVDRILEFEKGHYIRGYKQVTATEPVLQGHFPGNPIMPGVIMIEGLAQTSAVLGKITKENNCNTCLLLEINDTRFRRQVVPGDRLDYLVTVLKRRGHFFWFEGEASVDGDIAASARFSAKVF